VETTTAGTRSPAFVTPDWVKDAVFYQIFPDRFARSLAVPKPANLEPWESPPTIHGFKGGDLLGVADHLDYLQDLGITAIYFCPVFRSTANHRYHTHDYYEVDPVLGGNPALATLRDEAHRRGIRIVLDGVFNHCGRGFFQFNHILENGPESPYIDWFTVYSWPLHPYGPPDAPAGYNAWWNDRALPEFNTSNPAVRDFLWRVGQFWIDWGIDGWRLDVPNEIDDDDFWREFRRRVKAANADAYIVGEIWDDARRWLAGDQFDAVMNYLFTRACLGFLTRPRGMAQEAVAGNGLNPVEPLDGHGFASALDRLARLYPHEATLAQLNLLDSHDTARFLHIARGDESALRLAYLVQMTFPGAPCVYYGDEIGMSGGDSVEAARGGFIWDSGRWNTELREYVKGLIGVRHRLATLRRGDFSVSYADDTCCVFTRRFGGELAVVGLNAGEATARIDVAPPTEPAVSRLEAVWGGEAPELHEGGLRNWVLPPRSGTILTGTAG